MGATERSWRTVVDRIERTASRLGRAQSGRCSIEGLRLVERALRAGFEIEAAVTSQRFRDDDEPRSRRLVEELQAAGCELHVVPDEVVLSLTEGRGLGEIVGLLPLPQPARLDEVCSARAVLPPVFLAACDIEEPGNTGALVRTALAGGAAGFVALGTTDPWHPKALRTAMGSTFKIPVLALNSATVLIDELRKAGGLTYAAASREGAPPSTLVLTEAPVAFLLGGESQGLPRAVCEAADGRVSIPMAAGVDSFSINAAAAILLYEAVGRRRRVKPPRLKKNSPWA